LVEVGTRLGLAMFSWEKAVGGRAMFGEVLGVLVHDGRFPRIPGDAGNASTYPFTTRLKVVRGLDPGKAPELYSRKDPVTLQKCIQAAQELESEGVRAITTVCGFALMIQDELQDAVNIPVFTSSLLQLPIAYRTLKKGQKIGIITANSMLLTKDFLSRAGMEPKVVDVVVVAGLEKEPRVIPPGTPPNVSYPRKEEERIVRIANKLVSDNPEVGAIFFECHNLPPYAAAVQEATGLPVFDVMSLVKMVIQTVDQRRYTGIM